MIKESTFPYVTNAFKVCENRMLLKTIKHSVGEKEEMNMSIIESNRTDNYLFAKYGDDDDKWKKFTDCHINIDTEDEMNMPIIESNRTENDLFGKYNDDDLDFDLDDELKELTEQHLDTDTEDEMIEDKIDDGEIKYVIDKIDDVTDDKIENMIEEEKEDVIEGNKKRTMDLNKINELTDQVNLLARIRNDFSKNVEEICGLMNELHNEIYSDDSWLRLFELNKINVLTDEALDYVWKTFYGKNREKHETINIDKDKDIDGYVSKYTNIVKNKLELVNRIGEFLDSTMIDVQNEVCMINELKQASEIDIDTLKLMHNTLTKILKKWRDIVLETINIDNACSKTKDTEKKDSKPDTKKKDSKPDTKKKYNKPDTKKKDNKPDTSKKN